MPEGLATRQAGLELGGGGRPLFSGEVVCLPGQQRICPVQAPRGGKGMGEILGVEGFKGQQVVAVFSHPTLCSSLYGLSSQLERLYRPQTWMQKRTLGPGASSAGFQTRCELKDLLQLSLVIQVLQDWRGVVLLLRPWMLQETDICFSKGTQAHPLVGPSTLPN